MQHGSRTHARRRLFVRTTRAVTAASAAAFALAGAGPAPAGTLDPDRAAGRLVHERKAYFFCTLSCAAAFARDPERFAE